VITPTPDLDLLVTPLRRGLGLVQALQVAVHALVECDVAGRRPLADPGGLEREVRGVDCALQDRRKHLVDLSIAELLSGCARFLLAFRRKWDVDPAREAVLEVP